MIYRYRIILDTKDDVFRDIEIRSNSSLEEFHYSIANAFGFGGKEMASFYFADEKWLQGEEIPLVNIEENKESMKDKSLKSLIKTNNLKLIYVYDFFSLWTFFVEFIKIVDENSKYEYPCLSFSKGEVPEEAPIKKFKFDNLDITSDEKDDQNFNKDHDLSDDYYI